MPPVPYDFSGILTVVSAVVGLAVSVAIWMRFWGRRLSRDRVEVIKDRAETDIIAVLQRQINETSERFNKLYADWDSLQREFHVERSELNHRILILDSEMSKVQDDNKRLKAQNEDQSRQLQVSAQRIIDLQDEIDKVKQKQQGYKG
jgi:chromosome segregation ATPase